MKKMLSLLLALSVVLGMLVLPAAAELPTSQQQVGNAAAAQAEGLTFPVDGSNVKRECPACAQTVIWTAFDGTKTNFGGGKHLYLAGDVVLNASQLSENDIYKAGFVGSGTSCLHLNGKSLTVTDQVAVRCVGGTTNIMGKGAVTGNYNSYGSSAVWASNGAVINLYGGTYVTGTNAHAGSPVIMMGSANYGTVNIYGDTVIQASAVTHTGTPGSIYVANDNGELNLYGGTVAGGISNNAGGNIRMTKGRLNIYGGTVLNGSAPQGSNISLEGGSCTISGGTVTGGDIYMGISVIISGDPVIEKLTVPTGSTFTVGQMTGGAVGVSGRGILSSNSDLQTAAQYFYGADAEGDAVVPTAAEGKLSYSPGKLELVDGTGWCAVCAEHVTWAAKGASVIYGTKAEHRHMYLTADITDNPTTQTPTVYVTTDVCLHLNGFNINAVNVSAVQCLYHSINQTAGNLKLLGSGSITSANSSVINVTSQAKVSLYGGVNVVGGGTKETDTSCVVLSHDDAEFEMYGGSITEGKAKYGANVRITKGNFTLYGGEITDGTAWYRGGNVYAEGGNFTMHSGTLTGGTASKGENLYVVKTAEIHGGTITGGESAVLGAGTAAYVNGGTLTLKNSAQLCNEKMQGNIFVQAGKLQIDSGFTGKASVGFQDMTEAYGQTPALGASTGDYTGTLLYENGEKPNIYGADGKLLISGAQIACGGETRWAKDPVAEQIAQSGSYVKLFQNDGSYTIPDGQTLTVDMNGKTATFTGNGTLRGMDSTGDSFTAPTGTAVTEGNVTVEADLIAPNGNRYLALSGEGYSFHRLDMRITKVSLRTSDCGIYYTAKYTCDPVLAAKATLYGVAVSLEDMPGSDVQAEDNECTELTPGTDFGSSNETTSAAVFNIMKSTETAKENQGRGEMPIYANPYICFNMGTPVYVTGDTRNPGKVLTDVGFDGISCSLLDVMIAIDQNYESFAQDARERTDRYYFQWAETGMSWGFGSIGTSPAVLNEELKLTGDRGFCAVCKKTVTWKKLSETTPDAAVSDGVAQLTQQVALQNGDHYYLDMDVSYTSTGTNTSFISASGTAGHVSCIHLNGHKLTATNKIAIYGSGSVLNVLGNGEVTGHTTTANYGAAVQINNATKGNGINLYGGTYKKTANSSVNASVVTVSNAGGNIRLYQGVTIKGGTGLAVSTGTAKKKVSVMPQNSNIFLYGAAVEGTVKAAYPGDEHDAINVITVADGTMDKLDMGADTQVTLSGAPKIGLLTVAEGERITLGQMEAGTDISVSATGCFAEATEQARSYVNYFTNAKDGCWLLAQGNTLVQAVISEAADATALNTVYTGTTAYHGEMHNHTSSGEYGDGKYSLAEWKVGMEELKMDFATIVDHHQSTHMRLPEWDNTIFVGGSEPAAVIVDQGYDEANDSIHYNMIFSDPDRLVDLVKSIPEFAYKADDGRGTGNDRFEYFGVTQNRMRQVAQAVLDAGGFFVHVHPKFNNYLMAEDPEDYLFAEYSGIEILTGEGGLYNMNSRDCQEAYEVWTDLLDLGHKVYATAGSDRHAYPDVSALTTLYSTQKHADAYLELYRAGRFNPGPIGIRMAMGETAMGGETDFAGKRLVFSVGDFHESLDLTHTYRVELYDDQGVVVSAPVSADSACYFAVDADETAKFYRVVVWDDTAGIRVAVGNPIWND